MTFLTIPIAISAGFVLASVALSFVVLWRASILLRSGASTSSARVSESTIEVLQQKVDALRLQVEELHRRPAAAPVPHAPRAALNLDRRSQALRMHRRGEAAADIAAALDVPRQEVDLLIKVHRIVLRAIE